MNTITLYLVLILAIIQNGTSTTTAKSENELKENEDKLLNKVKDLQLNQTKVDDIPDSCIPFGNSPGVHKIALPGMDAFDVLCDSQTAGPGWIVIQHTVSKKKSNFNRDWATFREGFGTFDGDYFLGLEKIHRLTSSRRYELFMRKVCSNVTLDSRYDNFEVANEMDDYTLRSLGTLSMSELDSLRYFEHHKFSTFDRENDLDLIQNCAKAIGVGWWHVECYYHYKRFFFIYDKFMMLIRPKE